MTQDMQCTQTNTRSKPGLYIVATPIGHCEDITLRALKLLSTVDYIVCEDTRVSKKLLNYHSIATRLHVYNDHSTDKDRERILRDIAQGSAVALISDAGTPMISDPGYKLVQAAYAQALPVTSLPGACAAITALTLSGLPSNHFTFAGFLPAKTHARQAALRHYVHLESTVILYESAKRLTATLLDMQAVLGDTRHACIARELTKTFEEIQQGSLVALIEHYSTHGNPKGEVVIILAPAEPKHYNDDEIIALLTEQLSHMSVKDAVDMVTNITHAARKHVYTLALKISK